MATTHEYLGNNGFNVQIRLIGKRGCILLKWLPYLSGREIKFKVSMKDKAINPVPYEWRLSARDAQSSWWVKGNKDIPVEGIFQSRKKDEIINVGTIFRAGQHSFQMRWKDEIINNDNFQDMVYFYVEDNDVFISRWVLGLFAGVIGGLIVWLLSNLVH